MAKDSSLNIFVPLSKVDEENRLVYGLVAEEIVDNAGELFDYESSKPNFEKWSATAETMSRGLSKGNLRSMHGSVAAGIVTDLGFDDDNRRIECCAKVVDDNEWRKVLAGVYTGFSMGGKYEKRWVEKTDSGEQRKRYTALPCEISLVDKPCIPTATFDFVKADGVVVEVHHGDVLDEEAAEELEKGTQPREPKGTPKGGQFASTSGIGGGLSPEDAYVKARADYEAGGKTTHREVMEARTARDAAHAASVKAEYNDAIWSSARANDQAVKSLSDPEIRRAKKDPSKLRAVADQNDEHANRYESHYRKAKADPSRPDLGDPQDKVTQKAAAQLVANMRGASARMRQYADKLEGKIGKADNGDNEMSTEYVPTNDELAARGISLAKAAGRDEATWLDFMEEARSQLVAEHLAKSGGPPFDKEDEKKDMSEDEKKDMSEDEKKDMSEDDKKMSEDDKKMSEDKGDTTDAKKGAGLQQVWKTSDGETFLKKADAVSHQKSLDDASSAPKTLVEQLEMAKAAVNSLEKADGEEAAEEGEGGEVEKKDDADEIDKAAGAECEKYAKFFDGLDADTLRKGMYEVSRMASALRECASLQLCVASEARREGDGSSVPAAILEGVKTLGDALIAMAKEEVEELTARLAVSQKEADVQEYVYPNSYMALATSTLGLEKSDLDEMAKKDIGSLEKRDDDIIAKFTKIEDENALLKADLAAARKEIDEATPLIKSLIEDVERIKKLPRPSAPVTSVALNKSDDVAGESVSASVDLSKFTPDQLADAAIRMAQSHGRSIMAARGGSE